MSDFIKIFNDGIHFIDSMRVHEYCVGKFLFNKVNEEVNAYYRVLMDTSLENEESTSHLHNMTEKMMSNILTIQRMYVDSYLIVSKYIFDNHPEKPDYDCTIHITNGTDEIFVSLSETPTRDEEMFVMMFASFKGVTDKCTKDVYDYGISKLDKLSVNIPTVLYPSYEMYSNEEFVKAYLSKVSDTKLHHILFAAAFCKDEGLVIKKEVSVQGIISVVLSNFTTSLALHPPSEDSVCCNICLNDYKYDDYVVAIVVSMLGELAEKDAESTKEPKIISESEVQAKENTDVFNALCTLKECCARHRNNGDCGEGCPFDMGHHCALMQRNDIPKEWCTVHPETYIAFRN